MAAKKSELYSRIWASCDDLRGGQDASQYKDYALVFSKNRADDDALGNAYEYLMRHFATESGKSEGRFQTPAEVSRVIGQMIGVRDAATTAATTVYDRTCGSGSLLLKVGAAAGARVTLYGQEKDAATSASSLSARRPPSSTR